MANKRVIPKFATEAEEADWYFEHADELAEDFVQAAADGTLGRGTIARRFGLTGTIKLPDPDVAMAQEQAARQGVNFERYVQGLIHDALVERDQSSTSDGTQTAAAA